MADKWTKKAFDAKYKHCPAWKRPDVWAKRDCERMWMLTCRVITGRDRPAWDFFAVKYRVWLGDDDPDTRRMAYRRGLAMIDYAICHAYGLKPGLQACPEPVEGEGGS